MLNALVKFFGFDSPPPPPPLPPKRRKPVAPSAKRDNGATGGSAPPAPAPAPAWSMEAAKAALQRVHEESPLPLSQAVRRWWYDVLPPDQKKAKAVGVYDRRDPAASARAALGPERLSYLRCCLHLGLPLPLLTTSLEGQKEHEELYERRLDRAVSEDLDTWERGIRIHDAETAKAKADGLPLPAPLRVPLDVELALARRAAERLEQAEKRFGRSGGTAGKAAGGGPAHVPKAPKAEAETPEPPAGPKVK